MSCGKEEKALLRKKIKELQSKLLRVEIAEKSKKIQTHLFNLAEFRTSSRIMFYVSMGKEVFTHQMIERALEEGKEVAVPLTLPSPSILLPCLITNFTEDLEEGPWGILQPKKSKIPAAPECFRGAGEKVTTSIDLVIVPGLAFDRKGNRLGRGKGFYDRFLASLPPSVPKIALAFSRQIVEKVPTDKKDIPVDKIISEEEVISKLKEAKL